ncbi:MAG TPA: hypothetical protein VFS86_07515 [Rhodanobacteraceae bacterium]|nr:hypothetical protein [Rhodanobacteraceae bacterium]
MPRPTFLRPCVLALGAALCCATALPAAAATPVNVTFQPNNPWAQEVDTLSRTDNFHEYAVDVAVGKILQINLITRDPNVFFKIRQDGSRRDLVDTYKTGATTWSAPVATAATHYLIHVYIQPGAVQRNGTPKYALQIGQYGQADLRVPATPVTFTAGNPWVQESGTLDSQGSARDYTADIAAGQTLAVNLVTNDPKVHFKVASNGQTLVDNATSNVSKWSAPVATAATYTVSVYADPATLPPGTRAGYTVQFGHYAQSDTQAAPAGSTAAPAAGAPATGSSSN